MKNNYSRGAKSITGHNGNTIEIGDIVLYVNNPFCKPSEVVGIVHDTIYTSNGNGDAKYYKIITQGKKQ